jgi:hypothetical protein
MAFNYIARREKLRASSFVYLISIGLLGVGGSEGKSDSNSIPSSASGIVDVPVHRLGNTGIQECTDFHGNVSKSAELCPIKEDKGRQVMETEGRSVNLGRRAFPIRFFVEYEVGSINRNKDRS